MKRVAILMCAVGLSWTGHARADRSAEVADFLRAAKIAFDNHDYNAAGRAFDAAYAIAPRGDIAYNGAIAWQLAATSRADEGEQNSARAADDFALALTDEKLTPAANTEARARLAELETKLAIVHITSEKDSMATIGQARELPLPTTVHLGPGQYDLMVSSRDGRRQGEHVVVAIGETSINVVLPPPPPVPKERVIIVEPPTAKWMLPVGIGGLALGTAFAAAGVGFGFATLSKRESFDQSGQTNASLHDSAVLYRTLTNVSWVACGVAAVVGIVLLIAAPKSPRAKREPNLAADLLVGTF